MKTCCRCKEIKDLDGFYRNRCEKDGRARLCKSCSKTQDKLRDSLNREKKSIRAKKWYKENHQEVIDAQKEYAKQNKDKIAARQLKWKNENREHCRKRDREYARKQSRDNIQFRLKHRLRSRIRGALRSNGARKAVKTMDLIGCSALELQQWIQGLFTAGMSWEGLMAGLIHIDHIKPCSSFDLTDPEQQKACFHYTNLQPLWRLDNLRKNDKLDWGPIQDLRDESTAYQEKAEREVASLGLVNPQAEELVKVNQPPT